MTATALLAEPVHRRTVAGRSISCLATIALLVSLVPALVCVVVPLLTRARGDRLMLVTSGSMAPEFEAGEVVLMRPQPVDQLRPGMVVTFHPVGGEQLETHRIVSLRELPDGTHIQTQGDANVNVDPNFTPVSSVVGRAEAIPSVLADLLDLSQTHTGRSWIYGTPMVLVAVMQLLSFRRSGARRGDITTAAA